MIKTNLYESAQTHQIVERKGCFSILEYDCDRSVIPEQAAEAYFAAQMNVKKKQLIAELDQSGIYLQSGNMQLMLGDKIQATTGVTGAGDLIGKFVGGKVTGEKAIKPHYVGTGTIVSEPTYKFILLEDLDDWGGNIVIEDGMFLACTDTVEMKVISRTNVSSALFGNEGLFNMVFRGKGMVAMECSVPRDELIELSVVDDEVKIDGNMAVAWSQSLDFTVEKAGASLVGSMMAGEGLVNVYRGTGKILVAPVRSNWSIDHPDLRR